MCLRDKLMAALRESQGFRIAHRYHDVVSRPRQCAIDGIEETRRIASHEWNDVLAVPRCASQSIAGLRQHIDKSTLLAQMAHESQRMFVVLVGYQNAYSGKLGPRT